MKLQEDLVDLGIWITRQGWCPAGLGKVSVSVNADGIFLLNAGQAMLTKEIPSEADVENIEYRSERVRNESISTRLHTLLHQLNSNARYIISTHSLCSTVYSRVLWDGDVSFKNYEIQNAFTGVNTHEETINIPVFSNIQEMEILAARVTSYLQSNPLIPAFALAGHGIFSWGESASDARRHCEAIEFLMACEYSSYLLLKQ